MLTLDVGCGNRKLGDVNVDIKRSVCPDVVCDIHYLPFKNEQFNIVYCYHVLEHRGVEPLKAIKELKRICMRTVEIQVPHWLSPNAKKDKTHVNFQVMRRRFWEQFKNVQISMDYVKMFPFLPVLVMMRPNNITVKLTEAYSEQNKT